MRNLIMITLVLAAFSADAYPQCYTDTGKHTCFEYPNLRNESDLSPFPYRITQDFAEYYANPNTYPIYLRATLVADDPDFVYTNGCVNKINNQCIGTYQFPDVYLNAYSSSEANVTFGVQARDAFPPCNVGHLWTGTLRVESVAKNGVSARPFYSFSPYTFNTGRYMALGDCFSVFDASWQAFSATIPIVWDSGISRLVGFYANGWHNTNSFPKGWQTVLSIYHSGNQSTQFTMENHTPNGFHGITSQPCFKQNNGVMEYSDTISPGQTKSVNVYDFQVPLTARMAHDSVIFVRLNPVTAGLQPGLHLTPRTSGSALCQGAGEP